MRSIMQERGFENMIENNSKQGIEKSVINDLVSRIMPEAESCAKEYQKEKKNSFHEGMAQAYTEIFDNIQYWAENNDIDLGINLEQWAAEHLG